MATAIKAGFLLLQSQHTSIVLRPNSFDNSYKSINIQENNGAKMRVVGEFITSSN